MLNALTAHFYPLLNNRRCSGDFPTDRDSVGNINNVLPSIEKAKSPQPTSPPKKKVNGIGSRGLPAF